MPSSRTRSGFAILALAWLIGGGLLAAPQPIGEAVRAAVRDALEPGQTVFAQSATYVGSLLHARRADHNARKIASLQMQRDLWRDRYFALLARSLDPPPSSIPVPAPDHVVPTEPLVVDDLVQARVLGVERDFLHERLSRLLDRGASDGVAVDDLVLSESLPLLDLGTDHRLQADMPVLSGGQILGRISRCGRWTSTVQPVTHRDFRAFVQLVRIGAAGPIAGAEGVLAGNGDGTCRLELVDDAQPVSIGDFVCGRRADFEAAPPCYGRVSGADLPPGVPCWNITVVPFASLDERQTVQVLRELPNPARIAGLNPDRRSSPTQ